MSPAYLEVSQEAGAAFFSRNISGEVVMLNLLRFRQTADYSAHPELAPAEPVSGERAYRMYMEHTLPLLRAKGGDILFAGEGGSFLIGPADERWDLAVLVRQPSLSAFLAFASDPEYLAGMGHREAGVKDSRLLPLLPEGS